MRVSKTYGCGEENAQRHDDALVPGLGRSISLSGLKGSLLGNEYEFEIPLEDLPAPNLGSLPLAEFVLQAEQLHSRTSKKGKPLKAPGSKARRSVPTAPRKSRSIALLRAGALLAKAKEPRRDRAVCSEEAKLGFADFDAFLNESDSDGDNPPNAEPNGDFSPTQVCRPEQGSVTQKTRNLAISVATNSEESDASLTPVVSPLRASRACSMMSSQSIGSDAPASAEQSLGCSALVDSSKLQRQSAELELPSSSEFELPYSETVATSCVASHRFKPMHSQSGRDLLSFELPLSDSGLRQAC